MSSTIETLSLANELLSAYSSGSAIETPPSARSTDFDLTSAYAVEAAFASQRIAAGHRVVGLKVGFANKAAWRILKLETLAWAHMYDDTVQYANGSSANFALPPHCSLKIEPEIVFKLKDPVTTGVLDAATVLKSYFDSGKLRPLAVISAQRSRTLPEVIGMQEAGVSGVDIVAWNGLTVPARTPRDIIDILNRHYNAILKEPEVRTFFFNQGFETEGGTPEVLARRIELEVGAWSRVIRELKIDFN